MFGVLLIAVWGGICLYGLIKHNYISINLLTVVCVMQNFVLIIASPYVSRSIYTLTILIKEIYVWGLVVYALLKRRRNNFFDLGCLLAIVFIVSYGVINNSGSFSGALVSVRQLYLPFMFYLLGRSIIKTEEQIENILRYYVNIMVFCVAFGIIELLLLRDQFWIKIGFSTYAKYKGIESGLSFDTGVHGAFYTWDLGFRFRRLVSFMAEPVILGQLIAFALIIAIFFKSLFKSRTQRYIYIMALSVGLLLTMAKGGILIALYAFAFVLGKMWKNKELSFIAKVGFVFILILGIIYTFSDGSTSNGSFHFAGLTENVRNLPRYFFGRGIGSVGNLGYSYGGRGTLNANGESFIGAVIGQMGIFGIAIFSWFYFNLFKKIKKTKKSNLYDISNIICYLNIGLFLTSFVNNTAISFTSCFIYYIMAGAVCSVYSTIRNTSKIFNNIRAVSIQKEII